MTREKFEKLTGGELVCVVAAPDDASGSIYQVAIDDVGGAWFRRMGVHDTWVRLAPKDIELLAERPVSDPSEALLHALTQAIYQAKRDGVGLGQIWDIVGAALMGVKL